MRPHVRAPPPAATTPSSRAAPRRAPRRSPPVAPTLAVAPAAAAAAAPVPRPRRPRPRPRRASAASRARPARRRAAPPRPRTRRRRRGARARARRAARVGRSTSTRAWPARVGGGGGGGGGGGRYVAYGGVCAPTAPPPPCMHVRACTVWHGVRLQHRDSALVEARRAFRVREAQQEQQVAALHRRALRRRRRRRAVLRSLEGRGECGERARGGLAVGRHGEAREGARYALEVRRPQAERGRQLAQLQLPLALQLVGRQAGLALAQQRAPHALRLRHARHGAAQHRQLLGGDRALPPRAAHRAAQLARRLVLRQPQPRRLPTPPRARAQAVYPLT